MPALAANGHVTSNGEIPAYATISRSHQRTLATKPEPTEHYLATIPRNRPKTSNGPYSRSPPRYNPVVTAVKTNQVTKSPGLVSVPVVTPKLPHRSDGLTNHGAGIPTVLVNGKRVRVGRNAHAKMCPGNCERFCSKQSSRVLREEWLTLCPVSTRVTLRDGGPWNDAKLSPNLRSDSCFDHKPSGPIHTGRDVRSEAN